MNNKIKQEMDTIEIPPELHQRSLLGIQQAVEEIGGSKRRTDKRFTLRNMMVASLLGFILLSSAIFNTQVLAAIQKALQYVPGIGIVKVEDTPKDRYVLKHPITTQSGGGTIVITGVMVDEEMTIITITGTNTSKFDNVTIINSLGTEYVVKSSASLWSPEQWTATFYHQGELDIKGQVKLIMHNNPDITIALMLVKAESFASYQDMGETVNLNDVTITAIAERVGEKGRVSLVSQKPKDFWIIDYDMYRVNKGPKVKVTDEKGKAYKIERIWGSASELYFNLSGSGTKEYTLAIPEMNVQYDDKVSIQIPTKTIENVNKTFEIAGFPVTITKTERMNNNELRMYVDLHYNEHTTKSLHNFKIDRMSHSAKINEYTSELEYLQFPIDPHSKKMKLEIVEPQVVIRGPWIFKFPADKYFNN